MPLHLQSITNDDQETEYFTNLLLMSREDPDELFVSKERKYILSRFVLSDELSGDPFGKIVFTMKVNEEMKAIEMLDMDITLNNEHRTELQFLELRDGSSEANEYYDAMTKEENAHLELETVCRHVICEELAHSCRDVSISAFPFRVTFFEDIEAFNKWAGFAKGVKVGGTEFTVHGFSEHYIMPGGTLGVKKKDDASYTFLLGKVLSWRDVRWKIGENALDFVITWLDTALGEIPVAMGRNVFDLAILREGAIIAMNADIKADLSKSGEFIVINTRVQ